MAGSPVQFAQLMSRVLPPGTELCCTTCLGDELRGNVVATDYHLKAVVLRILGALCILYSSVHP